MKIEKLRPENENDDVFKIKTKKKFHIDENYRIINFSKPFMCFLHVFLIIVLPLLLLIDWVGFSLRVRNRSMLKKIRGRGVLSVANHCCLLDTVFVGTMSYPRSVFFASDEANFNIPVARFLMRWLKAFPIPDSQAGFLKIIKPVSTAIKKHKIVHFFPEGSLWPYYDKLRPFIKGVFYLAAMTDAPVLPIVITFRPRRILKMFPPKATLTFLEPIETVEYRKEGMRNKDLAGVLSDEAFLRMDKEMKSIYSAQNKKAE